MKLFWWTASAVAAVLLAAGPALGQGGAAAKPADKPAPQITAQEVDAAIAQGVAYFWSTQHKDTGRFGSGDFDNHQADGVFIGGEDVMAMLALAYAHETGKPEFQKGLASLRELEPDTTYVLGLRIMVMAELYRQADRKHDAAKKEGLRKFMQRDANMLADFQMNNGGWIYKKSPKTETRYWDFSNTQLAILGLQQAMLCGVEIKPEVLIRTEKLYLEKQRLDGGWNYGRPGQWETAESYGSMTAAAVASLLIIRDLLDPGLGCPCRNEHSSGRRNPDVDSAIERGIKWLGDNFTASESPHGGVSVQYWLYAVERVAIATGFKYLGPHNWYAEGAKFLIGKMGRDGSLGGFGGAIPETSFAVLFLIKGRGPILMNKLQYDGQWDLHHHDLEYLARYVGDAKEQQINWQVINLSVPVAEMHDAPILYISAESPLKFSEQEKKKLREFTDTGGTIFLEASCGNHNTNLGWRKTCQEIWPEWELAKLDRTHPLWTADLKIMNPPLLWGISDGVRTFLLYAPLDVSCVWNLNAVDKNKGLFDLGSNLWAYTTDRGKLRGKLESHEVGASEKYAATQPALGGGAAAITVARVRHGGDWNVAGNYHQWATLSAATSRRCGLTITEAEPVAPGAAVPAGTTLLFLTGRASCDLDAAGQAWLKNYLVGGGFLFAEAALGDKRFDTSLRAMIGAAGLTFKRLDASSGLISGQLPNGASGYNVAGVSYTYALRDERMGKPLPELLGIYLGEKMVGVYSPYDIMFRQTGCEAFDCRGYDADDARALAVNLALYAAALAAPAPAAPGASTTSAMSATSAAPAAQ
jgi:hypothetical protein